jgi:hypothetical protein
MQPSFIANGMVKCVGLLIINVSALHYLLFILFMKCCFKSVRLWPCMATAVCIAFGLAACFAPTELFPRLLTIAKFFDVMLPVLGVSVLLKVLWQRPKGCSKKKAACCPVTEPSATESSS